MSNYVPGQSITLTRNPTYFGPAPKIQTIIFQIIPTATAQITGLLSGSLDYIGVEDPQLLTPLKSNPNITVQSVVQQDYYYVTLNTALAQFKDVRVRQALSLAIDKKGLIAAVLKGTGEVAAGPISPLQKYYYDANVAQYPYDPAKAVSLLEQAGYVKHSDGKLYDKSGKPLTISFTAGQYGYLVSASELIQQYWQKIGITVPFKVLDWNTYIQQVVVKRDYAASFAWWIAPVRPRCLSLLRLQRGGRGREHLQLLQSATGLADDPGPQGDRPGRSESGLHQDAAVDGEGVTADLPVLSR